MNREFTLSNGRESTQDLPNIINESFYISDDAYRVTFSPSTPFWQIGFRFSASEDVYYERGKNDFEWASAVFKDLYFSAENNAGGKSLLHIRHSNLGDADAAPELTVAYQEKKQVMIFLKFIPKTDELYVSCLVEDGEPIEFSLPLYRDFKFFQLYGWLYKIYYSSVIRIASVSFKELELDPDPFRVGEIVFRRGDMFNKGVLRNTNLIILPASGNGTVNPNIFYRASELNIPLPEKRPPGSVKIFDVSFAQKALFAGYAYSVNNDKSNTEVIRKICRSLEEALDNPELASVSGINLPLLGTGAGRLDPRNVARIYADFFNSAGWVVPVMVSIPSGDVFSRVKGLFIDELIPLAPDRRVQKPAGMLALEKRLGIEIDDENFETDEEGNLTRLDLSNKSIDIDVEVLAGHLHLEYLALNNCTVRDASFLGRFTKLTNLYLKQTGVSDFGFLAGLPLLTTLDIGYNQLADLSFISLYGARLRRLYLDGNLLENLGNLASLRDLEFLDVSFNKLYDLAPLAGLPNLVSLLISSNYLDTVDALRGLRELVVLDISHNRISDLGVLLDMKKLKYLTADKNPFLARAELVLSDGENHLAALRNFYARQAEANKTPVTLPAKVLLLGNHGAGKSSLLYYLKHKRPGSGLSSTHIIHVEQYRIADEKKPFPDAVFFDFGGQDYYHGLYRAFLSSGSVYLILWNESFNKNEARIDSTNQWTQDFSLGYWLAQKQYLESGKPGGSIDPVLLIQTFAEIHKRSAGLVHSAENDFYVSLSDKLAPVSPSGLRSEVNQFALDYLEASINDLIRQKQLTREEPGWYHDFLAYILNEHTGAGHQGTSLSTISRHYQYKGPDKQERLKTDLQQLHRQGLILYYKDDLPDVAWLNPVALVRYVHKSVLKKEDLQKYSGKIAEDDFMIAKDDIIALLIRQKVIFRHEAGREYIIPSFLPPVKNAVPGSDLITFGLDKPVFVLKFRDFIPFGLINQVICFFGELPDQKAFWRDRLIFVLEGQAKVLINIDFQLMEIKVYTEFIGTSDGGDKASVVEYLFYGIVSLYWDLRVLRFSEFRQFKAGKLKKELCAPEDPMFVRLQHAEIFYDRDAFRPIDLYISLDDRYFIYYRDLCMVSDVVMIGAHTVDEKRELQGQLKTIPVYPFQPFTGNQLRKRRRVVISYSKDDLKLVHKFIDYLVPLVDDELITDPWYCSLAEAGHAWDEEIRQRFDEADIIFFMVSENLMKVQYVKEHEIKCAIDRYRKFKNVKVVPVILHPYRWARKGAYDLTMFNALPYSLKPVSSFTDQNEAWYIISECVRIMIEKNLDPGIPDQLPSELRKAFERIRSDRV